MVDPPTNLEQPTPQAQPHQPNAFSRAGGTIVAEVLGQPAAAPIVFMHGWRSNRDSLREIASLFHGSHCVHLLDLPGFGEAPEPPSNWGTVEYADLVEQYLRERVRGHAILVGHSFGGRLAVRLAARRGLGIAAIVLMAVPGLPQSPTSRAALRRLAIRRLRRVLVLLKGVTGPALVDWHTRRFGSADYLSAGAMRSVVVRVVNEDLTEQARTSTCPVLLLWGAEDRETPPWIAARYRELMGGRATLVLLPHKDHFPYNGTGAHLCAFKIRSWLASHAQ